MGMLWHPSSARRPPSAYGPSSGLPRFHETLRHPQDVHGAWSRQWAELWQGPDTFRVQPRPAIAGPLGYFLRGLRRAVPVPPTVNDRARVAELRRSVATYPAQTRSMRVALDANPQTD